MNIVNGQIVSIPHRQGTTLQKRNSEKKLDLAQILCQFLIGKVQLTTIVELLEK